MKRLNVKLVVILAAVCFVAAGGAYMSRRFWMNHHKKNLRDQAKKAYEDENLTLAFAKYNRFLRYDLENPEAWDEVSQVAIDWLESEKSQRSFIGALETLTKAQVYMEPGESKEEVERRLLDLQIMAAKYDDAIKTLTGRVDDGGDNVPGLIELADDQQERGELLSLLALCYQRYAQTDDAMNLLCEMVGFDRLTETFQSPEEAASSEHYSPDELGAYQQLAQLLEFVDNDKKAAKIVIDHLVEANNDNSDAHLQRAKLALGEEEPDFALAEASLKTAIDLDAENYEAKRFLAQVYSKDRRFAEANQLLAEVVSGDPEDPTAYIMQSLLLMQQANQPENASQKDDLLAQAEERIDAGLAKQPNNQALVIQKIDLLINTERTSAAQKVLTDYRRAVGQDRDDGMFEFMQGKIAVANEQWREAEQKLSVAREKTSNQQFSLQIEALLAVSAEMQSKLDVAKHHWEAVLQRDPTHLGARIAMTRLNIQQRSNNSDGSLEDLEIMVQDDPGIDSAVAARVLQGVEQQRLQNAINKQLRQPESRRDWTEVVSIGKSLLPKLQPVEQLLLRAEIIDLTGGERGRATAVELLKQAREQDPENPLVTLAQANLALRGQDFAGAEKFLDEGIAATGPTPLFLLTKAKAVVLSDIDAPAKVQRLNQIAATPGLKPKDKSAVRFDLGRYLAALDAPTDAKRLWNAAIEEDPYNYNMHLMVFELARQKYNDAEMAQIAEKVGEVFGRDSAEYLFLAATRIVTSHRANLVDDPQSDRGILAEAQDMIRRAKEKRPEWGRLERLEGEISAFYGNFDVAVEQLEKVLELEPGDLTSARQLFTLLVGRRDLQKARNMIPQLGPGPHPTDVGKMVAEVYELTGSPENALSEAERVVGEQNQKPEDLGWLASMLHRMGRHAEAEEQFRKAIELEPTKTDSYLLLVDHFMKTEQKNKIAEIGQEGVNKIPAEERNLFSAQIFDILEQNEKAEQAYRAALSEQPSNPVIMRSLAGFLLRSNKREEARTYLKQLIDMGYEKGQEHFAWARRTLARDIAASKRYPDFKEAIALLDAEPQLPGAEGVRDVVMKATMLAERNEPGQWRRGLQMFEDVRQSRDLTPDESSLVAALKRRAGDLAGAREELINLAATLDSSKEQAKYQAAIEDLVEILIEQGDPASISSAETFARRLEPTRKFYADARLMAKRDDKAGIVRLVARLLPQVNDPSQLAQIAYFVESLGMYDEAENAFNSFQQAYSENPSAGKMVVAAFHGRRGNIDKSLEMLFEVAKESGMNKLIIEQGYTALSQNRRTITPEQIAVVENWITQSLQQVPNDRDLLLKLAEIRELQDRQTDVIRLYEDLMNRDDLTDLQQAVVMNNLAFNYAVRKTNAEEALSLVNRAIEIIGPMDMLLDTRGLCHLAAGNATEAVADLTEATFGSKEGALYFHRAWAEDAAGDASAAQQSLQKALDNQINLNALTAPEREEFDRLIRRYQLESQLGELAQRAA